MTLLLAGHETTSHALSWTLYLLAKNKNIQNEVIAEIKSKLNDKVPEWDDLMKLEFLSQVIDETLRIYPPVWAFGRKVLENDELRGLKVQAGSIVMLSPYFSHRNSQFWPESEQFKPERFSKGNVQERNKFSYLPFGGGPRQCIGKHFALMEIKLILIQFFQKYSVDLLSVEEAIPLPQITMSIQGGLKLRLTQL